MVSFIEPILRNKLWYWLEEVNNYDVWPEVEIDGGRIDLVARTPEDEYWGFELKGLLSKIGKSVLEQLNRYVESKDLDRVFLCSHKVDEFLRQLDGPTQYLIDNGACYRGAFGIKKLSETDHRYEEILPHVKSQLPDYIFSTTLADGRTLDEWSRSLPDLGWPDDYYEEENLRNPSIQEVVETLQSAITVLDSFKNVGVVLLPMDIGQGGDSDAPTVYEPLDELLAVKGGGSPIILRNPSKLNRTGHPSLAEREESLHYTLWRELGGLCEASVPNPKPSIGPHSLQIDLMYFQGGVTATEVLQQGGQVVGIEAKTTAGLTSRVENQLEQYLGGNVLSNLYLAVPDEGTNKAQRLLDDCSDLVSESTGILSIPEEGSIRTIREAKDLDLKNDGYNEKRYPYHVGYGNIKLANTSPPISYFSRREQ